jgi:PPOX class probable F420-dependent enzyme
VIGWPPQAPEGNNICILKLNARALLSAAPGGDRITVKGDFSTMAALADALVRELLDGRHVASLATENPDGSIHMVAVWYWFDDGHVYVATSSRSRKAQNLESNPKVSLMIDARDPAASFGINITGTALILTGDSSRKRNAGIHRKYLSEAALADPKVGPVFATWDDVTIQITPASVIAWDMRQADRQFFGGTLERNPDYLLPLER